MIALTFYLFGGGSSWSGVTVNEYGPFYIQSLIDNLSGDGGTVTLGAGTYIVTQPITITKDDVFLTGTGTTGTIIRMADNTPESNYGILNVNHCSNFYLSGIQFDGNRDGQGEYILTPEVIHLDYVNGALIEDCEVHHSKGDGIQPVHCSNVTVQNCHIHHGHQHAIHYNGVTIGLIAGNTITDDDNSLICMGHGGAKQLVVSGNTLARPKGYAIQVSANDAPAGMREDIEVSGNTINIGGFGGVTIADNATRITISDNYMYNCAASWYHISVGPGYTDLVIAGNTYDEPEKIQYR